MDFTFLYNKEICTVNSSNIEIKVTDNVNFALTCSKEVREELINMCRESLEVVFRQYNAQSFLFRWNENKYSLTFHPFEKDGKLVLELCLNGLVGFVGSGNANARGLEISTNYACGTKEHWSMQDYEWILDTEIVVS